MSGQTRGRGGRGQNKPISFNWASAPPSASGSIGNRRVIVPNIAAAGRLVEPTVEKKPISPERKPKHLKNDNNKRRKDDKAHKDGPGGSSTTTIIKSEGVFSHGFNDARIDSRTSKRKRLKNNIGEETVIGKLEASIDGFESELKMEVDEKKAMNGRRNVGALSNANAYEEFWQSDAELDEEELAELLKDGFISDLKKSSEMPFVLPSKDETQFRKLVSKKAMRDEDETNEHEMEVDERDEKSEPSFDAKFFAAAKSIRHMADNDRDSAPSMMLFQLPPSLDLSLAFSSQNGPQGNNLSITKAVPNNIPSNSLQHNDSGNQLANRHQHHYGLVSSVAPLGKLQFLRSGRVVLNVGGCRMDVSQAIPSNCYETLLRIESDPSPAQQPVASSSSLHFNAQQSTKHFPALNGAPFVFPSACLAGLGTSFPRSNSAQLLGEVSHQFVCSLKPECMSNGSDAQQKLTPSDR